MHPHKTWREGSARHFVTRLQVYRGQLRDYCCSLVAESPCGVRNLTQVLDPLGINGTPYPYYEH